MASPPLTNHLKRIASRHELLECPSPIHLGALLYGYLSVAPGFSWISAALDAQFAGPAQARAWTRAYLSYGSELGLTRLIEAAVALLEDPARPAVVVGPDTPAMFIDVVVAALHAKRPANVLGESTIPWLYNFGVGAQAALDDYFPEIAPERRASLSRFETWLQSYYDAPGVPWQRILRAFEGPSEHAVRRFASLWDEHLSRVQRLVILLAAHHRVGKEPWAGSDRTDTSLSPADWSAAPPALPSMLKVQDCPCRAFLNQTPKFMRKGRS